MQIFLDDLEGCISFIVDGDRILIDRNIDDEGLRLLNIAIGAKKTPTKQEVAEGESTTMCYVSPMLSGASSF